MRSHTDEIYAYQQGPLAWAIYQATKDVVVFKEGSKGAGPQAVDWDRTREARSAVERRVRREFKPEQEGSDGKSAN